jgi:hypothetical protein
MPGRGGGVVEAASRRARGGRVHGREDLCRNVELGPDVSRLKSVLVDTCRGSGVGMRPALGGELLPPSYCLPAKVLRDGVVAWDDGGEVAGWDDQG